MKVQGCLDEVLRRLFLEAEVVPEAEGGAINFPAFPGTVNPLALDMGVFAGGLCGRLENRQQLKKTISC